MTLSRPPELRDDVQTSRRRRARVTARRHANRLVVAATTVVAFPLIAAGERVRRGLGRHVARGAVRLVAATCGVRFAVHYAQPLDPARRYVFVPNHSSLLDIPAMLIARPDIHFVAAADLSANPLLALVMRVLGTVPLDRRNARIAVRQLETLASEPLVGDLVVFAEGGIAAPGTRLPFKSGAFTLAIGAGADVVPVAITGTEHVLPPGARWGVRPGKVQVRMLVPIETGNLTAKDRRQLRDETERRVLAALTAAA